MTVTLRDARSTDAGTVGALLTGFVAETPWMPCLHTGAQDIAHAGQMIDRGWVRVAEGPAGVVGFLARDAAWVHALYVALGERGKGIGASLLREAQQNAARLELWTFEANTGAHRFYERAGFVLAEQTDGATNDEGLPDRRYVWQRDNQTGEAHV